MSHIIETISGDRRLSLAGEEYLRPMGIGSNWGKIRVGIRFAVNGWSTVVAPGFLQIGLAADANSYFTADRPTGYIGVRFGGSSDNNAAPVFNAVQAATSYYTIATTDLSTIQNVNGTITQSARQTSGLICMAANTAPEHELMVTFTRAGTTYNLVDSIIPNTAGAVQAGKTYAQFVTDMDNETGAIAAFSNVTRNAYTTIQYSTTFNSTLPYVSIYWNRCTPTLEITHVMVTRFF